MKVFLGPFAGMLAVLSAMHIGLIVDCIPPAQASPEDGINKLLDYVFYRSESSFESSTDSVKEYTLNPGESILFSCSGLSLSDKSNEIVLYPADPKQHVMPKPTPSAIEDVNSWQVSRRRVYSSTNPLIHLEDNIEDRKDVLIQYTQKTIIMATDPQNFTLNFACVLRSKDNRFEPKIRWLKVSFNYVYPMGYGCETGDLQLFKNSAPAGTTSTAHFKYRCALTPQPGMVMGIYCQDGERLFPKDCNRKNADAIRDYEPTYNTPRDPRDFTGQMKLFQIPIEGLKEPVEIKCGCVNADGLLKRLLIIANSSNARSNFKGMLLDGKMSKSQKTYYTYHPLWPGRKYSFTVLKDGVTRVNDRNTITSIMTPAVNEKMFAYAGLRSGYHLRAPLKDIMGSRNFSLEIKKSGSAIDYTFNYGQDSIVVMKTRVMNIFYIEKLIYSNNPPFEKNNLQVDLAILPTDPWTYGCGVESTDLFREDQMYIQDETASNPKRTRCRLNPRKTSPIGFFCPKGLRMEPPDCFTHMILLSTDEVVPVSDYLPDARAIDGNHIRILDTGILVDKTSQNPSKVYDEYDENNEKNRGKTQSQIERERQIRHKDKRFSNLLYCKCLDEKGNERAGIYLTFKDGDPRYEPTWIEPKEYPLFSLGENGKKLKRVGKGKSPFKKLIR